MSIEISVFEEESVLAANGPDEKLWSDQALTKAVEDSAAHLGDAVRLHPFEKRLWAELCRRIMERRTHVDALFHPNSLLVEMSKSSMHLNQISGDFSWGSLHLLPCGYLEYKPKSDKKSYIGDMRFQTYWINAFYDRQGAVQIRFFSFPPYDREHANPRPGRPNPWMPHGYSIQNIAAGMVSKHVRDTVAISLFSRASIVDTDEGAFWAGIRKEMTGIAYNYTRAREGELSGANLRAKEMASEEGRSRWFHDSDNSPLEKLRQKMRLTISKLLD